MSALGMNGDFPGDWPLDLDDQERGRQREAAEILCHMEMQHPEDRLRHINGGEPPAYIEIPDYADDLIRELEPVAEPVSALRPITPEAWGYTESPKQRFLAGTRIPANDLTILTGNGGSGKTEIAILLLIAVAAGLGDWLGCIVERSGPVLFLSCEEPEEDIRIRVERICSHRLIDPLDLKNFHMIFPDLADCWLASADRSGRITKTPLMEQIETWVERHRPRLVVIDSAAATFDGEAIARRQVRSFLAMLRKVAREYDVAVVLLDHPSVRGLTDGSGSGNSVDWRNSVRAMLHLSDPDPDDPDARTLEVKKTNRGRPGEKVRLRWNGLTFTTAETSAAPSPYRAAAERDIDERFLALLGQRNAQGRWVTPNKASGYAPKELATMPGANGVTASAFVGAMERLLASGHVIVETFGPPSKQRQRLITATSNCLPTGQNVVGTPSNRLPTGR